MNSNQPAPSHQSGLTQRLGSALYSSLDQVELIMFLRINQPVVLIDKVAHWAYVETGGGTRGYIRSSDVLWDQEELSQ